MTSLAALTGGLAPIGLAELVARAELMTRQDSKYVLRTGEVPGLLAALPRDARVLEIGGRREFAYRSGYFDTPGLDGYRAAAHGRRRRFKLRVRSYLDTGSQFVEVKTSGRRGSTVKERIPYAGDHRRLSADARAFAWAVLADAGIRTGSCPFEWVLTSRYRRTTLFLPTTASRLTIDTRLAWNLPGEPALRVPDRVIVETKSTRARSDLDRLLWSLKHRPCPMSKYGTGLAALRPELPAHRWRPVLRRHFPHTAVRTSSTFPYP